VIEKAERRHIRNALERTGGSVAKNSELLGISRKTLWEKMKRLRIGNEPQYMRPARDSGWRAYWAGQLPSFATGRLWPT
jgi:hypothetical protein